MPKISAFFRLVAELYLKKSEKEPECNIKETDINPKRFTLKRFIKLPK